MQFLNRLKLHIIPDKSGFQTAKGSKEKLEQKLHETRILNSLGTAHRSLIPAMHTKTYELAGK